MQSKFTKIKAKKQKKEKNNRLKYGIKQTKKLSARLELPGDVLVFLNALQKLTAIQHFLVSSSFIRDCVPVNFT